MPLHTIGLPVKGSFYGITKQDVASIIIGSLYFWQPGVDHKAVMQWIIDNGFYGSIAFCSIFGTFFSHKLLEWGGLGFFQAVYLWEHYKLPGHARLSKNKVYSVVPWAWDDQDKQVGEKYNVLRKKSLRFIAIYHACVTIVQFFLFTTAIQWTWAKGGFQWEWIKGHPELDRADPERIPSKGEVAFQCLFSTVVAEFGFYWAHRLLHETRLYYWHKRHHEYKHSTAYAAFYVGFLDSVITDFIPAGFGIMFFEMHQWTVWMYTLPLIVNSLRVHCGIQLGGASPLGFDPLVTLPMATDAERTHDMHHRHNTCNYGGAIFLWDRMFGTWQDPDREDEMRRSGKGVLPISPQLYDDAVEAAKKKE